VGCTFACSFVYFVQHTANANATPSDEWSSPGQTAAANRARQIFPAPVVSLFPLLSKSTVHSPQSTVSQQSSQQSILNSQRAAVLWVQVLWLVGAGLDNGDIS